MCIAQNGPGVTNFVTAVAAAYWAHSPVVFITPETGSVTIGHGGFQETEQLPIFSKITRFQAHVIQPDRMAELTARCFDLAMTERGPTQLNIPRDLFDGEVDVTIPKPNRIERSGGGAKSLDEAREGAGRRQVPGDRRRRRRHHVERPARGDRARGISRRTGRRLLPAQRCLPRVASVDVRTIGYQGSKAAMKVIAQADVVLALGTRLGPFGTLPQHGIEYWPKDAKIIQVDVDQRMLGLVKKITSASAAMPGWRRSSCCNG